MFGYLRLRWELWWLERAYRNRQKGTDKAVKAASARDASAQDIETITGGSDDYLWRQRIYAAQTRYLCQEADRLIVTIPDIHDQNMWIEDGDRRFLTREGFAQLRSGIRAERKARAERFVIWAPSVIGILGALIGLVSLLVSRK